MISKFRSRRLLLFLVFVACALGFNNRAQAAVRYSAAYLYADYVSGGPTTNLKYKVTLIVAQRCESGAPGFHSNEDICFYNSAGVIFGSKTLPLVDSEILAPYCPSVTNSCADPSQPYTSFQIRTYSDTVTLSQADQWNFEWHSWPDHREATANMYKGPGTSNYFYITLKSYIDNLKEPYACTPRYTAKPDYTWCLNSHNVIPLSPYDPNGDSLFTQVITPITSGDASAPQCGKLWAPATFYPGYGTSAPIDASSSDPFYLNPVTGVITCTPTGSSSGNNRYDLCFETDKLDPSNYLLGYCRAEMVVDVQSDYCATPPSIDTFPYAMWPGATLDTTGGINTIYICPKTTLNFKVRGTTASSTDKLYLTVDNASTPSSTMSIVGTGSDAVTGDYNWIPTGSDVGTHTVTFTVTDSTCSGTQTIVSRSHMTVFIHVFASVVATKSGDYCQYGDSVQLHVTGPYGAFYTWTDTAASPTISDPFSEDPYVAPAFTSTYIVTSSVSTPCKNADTITVFRYDGVDTPSAGPDHTICKNQTTVLEPTIPTDDTLYWTPTVTLDSPLKANAQAFPKVNTTYALHVFDPIHNCSFHRTTNVIIDGEAPLLDISALPDSVCPEGSSQLRVVVEEQPNCGAAIKPCSGSNNNYTDTKKTFNGQAYVGNNSSPGDPVPFSYFEGGNRDMILYTKKELEDMGMQPGYINSMTFYVSKQNLGTDVLSSFQISMGCTNLTNLNGSPTSGTSYPSVITTTVYPASNFTSVSGANTFYFTSPYYWDGNSGLVVDICYSHNYTYPGKTDVMEMVNTNYVSSQWYTYGVCCGGSGCGYTYGYGFNERPMTTFNECVSVNDYDYTWNPASWPLYGKLSATNIYNPVASDITKKTMFHVKVVPKAGPSRCYSIDSVAVAVDTSVKIKAIPESIIMCRPGYQPLGSQAFGPAPYINLSCGTSNPQSCPVPDTCTIGDPNTTSSDIAIIYDYAAMSQYIVTKDELKAGGMFASGTIRQIDIYQTGYSYYTQPFDKITIKMGCTPKTSFSSNSDFIKQSNLTTVFSATTYAYTIGGKTSFQLQTPYNWDTTQNLVVEFCVDDNTWNYDDFAIRNTPGRKGGIMNYFWNSNSTTLCDGGTSNTFYNSPMGYTPVMTFEFCPAPSGTFAYTWKPGTFLSDSTAQNPVAYVTKSTKYSVLTQGRNNCWVHDSVEIFLPTHDYDIYPKDTAFCDGESYKLRVKGGTSTTLYKWYQNGFEKATTLDCDSCASPTSMPRNSSNADMDTTTYQLVVTDSVNCSDTLKGVRVVVKPIPIITAFTHDTTIDYGSSVRLSATGASIYTWWPTGSLSNPNVVNPVASPTEPTTYTVRGLAADGCASTDTIHVGINYRGKLFVPSAFTPNGDGKNDHFRVANLTFEKIIEFHVYNRWGQEVFSSSDNTGWDGNWNNVPQDMGTYEYLIRVGFPDGFIQTFKGNITLIR